MKNILIIGASRNGLNDKVLDKVLAEVEVNNIFLLVHKKEDAFIFQKYGRCIYREDTAKGKYGIDDINMGCSEPLDDTVFSFMAPHILEILNQQRRFEEYHAFHIPASYEAHYTIYMHNLFFWNNLLVTEKITHTFFACLPHEGYDSIVYYLCKMRNIPVKMIYNATLPKRYYVLTDFMNPEESLKEAYQELRDKYHDSDVIPLDDAAEQLFQKWTSLEPSKMKPWYMEGNPLKQRFTIRFGVTNVFKAWEMVLGNIYIKYDYKMCGKFLLDCFTNIPAFFRAGLETFRRWRYARPVWKRTLELNRFYDSIAESPVEGERYIYFALHYQPEASSNPLGGREYADQIIPIHLLARSVPDDMKVYVKVHLEQLAPLRSREYYEDIKRIPNVRLIKSECSTYDLIQNAFAVSSLTGTVCWEAQFFGIPAILFGYSHKNLAPLSYHVRTYEDCQQAIDKITKKEKKATSKDMRILLKAMYENSFPENEIQNILPQILIKFFGVI